MRRRRLISSDEALPVRVQHKRPCSDCPLARVSLRGWLGGTGTPEDWAIMLHSDSVVTCHVLQGAQCAGAAIYRANVGKRPRDRSVLVLPENHSAVFSSPTAFIEHHKSKP